MHLGSLFSSTLTAMLFTAVAAAPLAAQNCNPQISLVGDFCICKDVEIRLDNNTGCFDFLIVTFNPGSTTLPGGITLPGAPPYTVLFSALNQGMPNIYRLSIPCRVKYIGADFIAFNASLSNGDVTTSVPLDLNICGGRLGDRVWCDENNDGVQDPNEPGIPGVTVNLDCGPSFPLASTVTGANGIYEFDRLPLIACTVSVDPQTVLLRKVPGFHCPTEMDVNLNLYGPTYTYLDADFCFVPCQPCAGGVTALRLRYTGTSTTNVLVRDRDNRTLFNGPVLPSGTFAFRGQRSDGTMGTEIRVTANNVTTTIHTSCSQPIGPGSVFGPYTVVTGESRTGGPVCPPSPCENGPPCSLTLRYTGDSCAASNHSMGSKVTCTGNPAFANPVRIRASDKSSPTDSSAKVWFDGTVQLDEAFTALSWNGNVSKLTNDTWFHVFNSAGTLLQTIKVHTSCSQPIIFGDQYGSLRLEAFSSEGNCQNPNECAAGRKPCSLTMLYTGDGCAATRHHMDPSKVSCSGDPLMAATVRIRASNKSSPTDASAYVWFDGLVDLNNTFELRASRANRARLENDTWLHIFSTGGTLLQTVKFHTSCSQPLMVDDQFGAARLQVFVGEGQCSGGSGTNLCVGGRPQTITWEYTGQDCTASSNIQSSSSWSCSGNPNGSPTVRIRATDNSNPAATGVNVYFDGTVNLGVPFTMDARSAAGQTRFPTNTYFYVYDGNNTLLQSIRIHTSCSQPMRANDQWGSLKLLGLTII